MAKMVTGIQNSKAVCSPLPTFLLLRGDISPQTWASRQQFPCWVWRFELREGSDGSPLGPGVPTEPGTWWHCMSLLRLL